MSDSHGRSWLRRVASSLGLSILIASVSPVAHAQDAPTAAVARATLDQQTVPALDGRRTAALARVDAAERFFAGDGMWEEAFPGLTGVALLDPAALRVAQWALQERAAARAAERVGAAPAGLSERDAARWRGKLAAACDAEDAADTLQQRFLAAMAAGVALAPELAAGSVDAELAELAAVRGEVGEVGAPPSALAVAAEAAATDLRALQRAAIRSFSIPGDAALAEAVARDFQRMPVGWPEEQAARLAAEAVVDRLARARPLLDGELAQATDAARGALWASRVATAIAEATAALASAPPAPKGSVEELEARAAAAEGAVEEAGAAVSAAPEESSERTLAELRLKLAERERDAVGEALTKARNLAAAGMSSDGEHSAVEAARQQAEQAAADAQRADAGRVVNELRTQTARMREEIANLLAEEEARRGGALSDIASAQARYEELATGRVAALGLPPLDPQRQPRLDGLYSGLAELVRQLQDVERARAVALLKVRSANSARLSDLDRSAPSSSVSAGDALSDWERARSDLREALATKEQHALSELDATVHLLRGVKQARRVARGDASSEAISEARRHFLPELVDDVREIPITVGAAVRQALDFAGRIPVLVTDLTAIVSFLTGSFELIALVVVWLWIRKRLRPLVGRMLDDVWAAEADPDGEGWAHTVLGWMRRGLEPGDPRRLAAPLGAFLDGLADIVAAQVLVWFVGDRVPVLGLLAWVWFARVAWRTWPSLVDVALATHEEARPSLRTVESGIRERTRWTIKAVLAWSLTTRILEYLCLQVLAANRLADVVALGATLAAWVLVVGALWAWAPSIQAAVAAEDGPIGRWVSTPRSRWLRPIQAAAGFGVLFVRVVSNVGGQIASSRAGLSWIGAAVARRQLREAAAVEREPLPAPVLAKLDAARARLKPREHAEKRLVELHDQWKATRRRGLVAVVGERGAGTEHAADGLAALEGVVLKTMALEAALRDSRSARAWLGRETGAWTDARSPSTPELIAALQALPPTVFVVQDLHRAVLRAVGGFDAVRTLIEVFQATSEEHFWLCTLHKTMWAYLSGASGAVGLSAFREVIDLRALSANDLEGWIPEVVAAAGYSLTYEGLRAGRRGDDERAAERERAAFWRLLAEASHGNPGVARQYFASALALGEGTSTVDVGLFHAPSVKDLEGLKDDDMFVLAGLIVHDGLSLDELVTVLNANTGSTRATCRRLESLGVLDGDEAGAWFRITTRWLPAVDRLLRQMSFLYA